MIITHSTMQNIYIKQFENKSLNPNLPKLDPGDTVSVSTVIKEGNKERVQITQGVIISVKNANLSTTITVRKVFQSIGVEKVYFIHSPKIINIEILKKSKVRRSKLFYLRSRYGKSARLKSKLV